MHKWQKQVVRKFQGANVSFSMIHWKSLPMYHFEVVERFSINALDSEMGNWVKQVEMLLNISVAYWEIEFHSGAQWAKAYCTLRKSNRVMPPLPRWIADIIGGRDKSLENLRLAGQIASEHLQLSRWHREGLVYDRQSAYERRIRRLIDEGFSQTYEMRVEAARLLALDALKKPLPRMDNFLKLVNQVTDLYAQLSG